MPAGEADEKFDEEEPVEGAPAAPTPPVLPDDDPRTALHERVRSALISLPAYFEFKTEIEGVEATDLFALNDLLGSAIEVQVVTTLNRMRTVWDPTPDEEWAGYRFERQSQAFPDVLLSRPGNPPEIAMGIELKGWYLLSKEGVPSLRFTTTPAACSPHDLIAVVPWLLSNVLSGTPVCAEPFVCSARWAAEYRNHWWQYVRKPKEPDKPRGVTIAPQGQPYPTKDLQISDVAEYDKGKNFGRLARTKGVMGDFMIAAKSQPALGIPIRDWVAFLKRHSDKSNPAVVHERLVKDLKKATRLGSSEKAQKLLALMDEVSAVLQEP